MGIRIRNTRRRLRIKKRVYRRKRTVKIIRSRMPSSGYLTTVRWSNRDTTNLCHFAITGSAGGTTVPLTTTFNLGDVASVNDFANTFDQYMIKKVLYRWVLRRDPNQASTVGAFPRILWVHDFNDQVAPASFAQLRQYANCREITLNDNMFQSRWYTLNAATLPLTYVTSLTSATGPKWRQWFDTSAPTVPHYGLKYACDQLFTNMTILLEVKYVLAFKGVV